MNPALSIAGRMAEPSDGVAGAAHALHVRCDDGVVLAAQLWRGGPARSVVIINPATSVLARYYHRYAHGSLRSHAYGWRAIYGLARFWQFRARWLENGRRCWDIGIIRPVTGHSLRKETPMPPGHDDNTGWQPMVALDLPPRAKPTNYPEPFASRMAGRTKRQLGDAFGLTRFGVNLTTLLPGAESALLHQHSHQQEFVYVLSGTPTLRTEDKEFLLQPGMCAGFTPGGYAHQLVNRSGEDVLYLEIGDRNPEDGGSYPEDDLEATWAEGEWQFLHKDGTPY